MAPSFRNILLLMADEFRFDAAGFMGNIAASTPVLDRLAAGAAVFDNAYTPSPVCVPARPCLAAGKYPRRIGCQNFGEDLAPGALTFARWFAEHGYYTVACGKLHHRGSDQMQGWLHRFGGECATHWPAAFSGRSQIGRVKWRGAPDLREAGPGTSPLALHDDYTVKGAEDFLRMHFEGMYPIPRETPLLLLISLQQPHFPFQTDQAALEKYLDRAPFHWAEEPSGHPVMDAGRIGPEDGVTEDDVRRATAAYYALVEQTDQRIGRVIEAIARCGRNPEEWGVVFLSDHGDMLGQHGLWEKRKFYEASVRVPLFFRWPGIPPKRIRHNASLVDVFPTLCALAGLPAPAGLDGRNALEAPNSNEVFSQMGESHFLLKRDDWKYLDFGGEAPELLFDLANDPQERSNLAGRGDLEEKIAAFRASLAEFRARN